MAAKTLPPDDDDFPPVKKVVGKFSGAIKPPNPKEEHALELLFRKHQVNQSGQNFWKFGEEVACSTFFNRLNKEFLRRTGTSHRPLSKDDHVFFMSLLNGPRFKNGSEEVVKLSAFAAGFWNWFEQFSNIIAEIPELWSSNDPVVVYLCTKAEAAQHLEQYRQGTFLMRFSESKNGYVSLAVKKKKQIEHLLFYKDDNGWNHDGDTVSDIYATIPELLSAWRAGKYVGVRRKDDLFNLLGTSVPQEESDEGPD